MNHCLTCKADCIHFYCSLSCSNKARTKQNEQKYNLNPKRCPQCNGAIPYRKRWENTFCSHSCAAKVTNSKRVRVPKHQKVPTLTPQERFQQGLIKERKALRKHLIKLRGLRCAVPACNVNATWCQQPITLIVDHIDGNAGNNLPENLRLLCPNCNSQTPTFGGRNKGFGRKSRNLPRE